MCRAARRRRSSVARPSEEAGCSRWSRRRSAATCSPRATSRDRARRPGKRPEGAGPLDEAGGPAATAKGALPGPMLLKAGLGDNCPNPPATGARRPRCARASRRRSWRSPGRPSPPDDSEGFEAPRACTTTGRASKKAAGRLRQRKAKKAAARQRKAAAPSAPSAGGARGPEAAGAAPGQAPGGPGGRAGVGRGGRAARGRGAASAIAGAASGAAPPALLGAVAASLAFVACARRRAAAERAVRLLGRRGLRQGLEGLPPYITTMMVEAALECQEEYGHPAAVPIAQIIQESGQGDRMSRLAERDHNLLLRQIVIFFTIFTNVFSPIAPTRMRRIRQRGCAAFGV